MIQHSFHFRSLRFRLLGPMIVSALLAAALVAIASYWLGSRWTQRELQKRFTAVEKALSRSEFPLNATVLETLASLTQTEIIGFDSSNSVTYGTTKLVDPTARPASDSSGRTFRVFEFRTQGGASRSDRVWRVLVLFDAEQIEANCRRAAILPLITGLSTIAALSSITLVMSSRLVRRIGKLQQRVERVADGNFESTVSDDVDDEIGRLGGAVDCMAGQLDGLWKQVNRQQSQKLLHQIAGGMAHQLRNSLTSARMAVEMHSSECSENNDEGLQVAIDQMEVAEDYVRRLLSVASQRQDKKRPTSVQLCFDDARTSMTPIAKHLRVAVHWTIDGSVADRIIEDGPTWVAAATNLVHNAIQAGDDVRVEATLVGNQRLHLVVSDNGPGVPESVTEDLFEPFVSSKSEGMGLGLPLVRRAAEYLDGSVSWHRAVQRTGERTVFELGVAVAAKETIS